MNTESDSSNESTSYRSVSGSPGHTASQDTEGEAVSNDGDLSWDYDTEAPSFQGGDPEAESSPVHAVYLADLGNPLANPTNPLADWPPRLLSSETDPHFLEAAELPSPRVQQLEEVFEEGGEEDSDGEVTTDTVTMPPKVLNATELYQKLEVEYRAWNRQVTKIKASGNKISSRK